MKFMINEKKAKRYCYEDISLIENYHQAIADKEKMWDVHHRRECDSEGRTLFTGKIGGKIGGKKNGAINGKKRSIKILQFSKDGTLIKEWPSIIEFERHLGIARSCICACCQGKLKQTRGFVWKYKN